MDASRNFRNSWDVARHLRVPRYKIMVSTRPRERDVWQGHQVEVPGKFGTIRVAWPLEMWSLWRGATAPWSEGESHAPETTLIYVRTARTSPSHGLQDPRHYHIPCVTLLWYLILVTHLGGCRDEEYHFPWKE